MVNCQSLAAELYKQYEPDDMSQRDLEERVFQLAATPLPEQKVRRYLHRMLEDDHVKVARGTVNWDEFDQLDPRESFQ